MPTPLALYHFVATMLLGLGFLGLCRRRTLVGMLISIELMLNGAGLAIAASGQLTEANSALAQAASLFVMGLAAAEATLLLAILVVVFRRFGSTKTADLNTLQE